MHRLISMCNVNTYKYLSSAIFSPLRLSGTGAAWSRAVTITRREEQTCKQRLIGWLNNHLLLPSAIFSSCSVILKRCLVLPRSWGKIPLLLLACLL